MNQRKIKVSQDQRR